MKINLFDKDQEYTIAATGLVVFRAGDAADAVWSDPKGRGDK